METRRSHMSEAPSSMVDRVVLILSVFERSSEALTAGQVSVRSGIPRSSVQRILQQLVSARWLKRHDDGYALGLRMFEIGSLVAHRSRITSVARPIIHELRERTGHVVHLAVLDQQDVVYLDKVGRGLCRHAALAGRRPLPGPLHRGREGAAGLLAPGHRQRVSGDGPAPADAGEPGHAGRPRGGDRRDPRRGIRRRTRRGRARGRVRRRPDPQLRRGRRRGLGLRAA